MSRDEEKFNELIDFIGCLTITGDELLELTGKIMEYGNLRADLFHLSTLEEVEKEISKKRFTDKRLGDSVHWFEIKLILTELKQRGTNNEPR